MRPPAPKEGQLLWRRLGAAFHCSLRARSDLVAQELLWAVPANVQGQPQRGDRSGLFVFGHTRLHWVSNIVYAADLTARNLPAVRPRSMKPTRAKASRNCTRVPARCAQPCGLRRFGALSIYPDRASAFWDSVPNPQDLRGYLMSKPWATFLTFTFLFSETAFAQPPVRKYDDPGSPPFKVLKTGE